DASAQLRACQPDRPGLADDQAWTDDRDLDGGGLGPVADQQVRESETPTVRRAGPRNAEMRPIRSSRILDRRLETAVDDLEDHVVETNRTSAPGDRRAGGSASGSKSVASVRPMRFQPPGIDR